MVDSLIAALAFNPPPPDLRQPVLQFPLSDRDHALIPLDQITEVLRVETTEILPVPEVPSCVLGICQWRGEILWVIDFHDLTGYRSPFQQEQAPTTLMVMVVQVEGQSLGIGVPQVNEVELHNLHSLQAAIPGLFPAGLLPLIAGILPESSDPVLDITLIARCPLWKNHPREAL